jgi:spore coat polysaccharide biosynthesis protein SpsF (cytidylyltransferase family)
MIAALIQARLGSTRLPNKVMMELSGKTVIEQVVGRVAACGAIDEVVVVTTVNPGDLPLIALCAGKGVRVFCGSEEDVLDRYYQAARVLAVDHVVRITADCPLLDPAVIKTVVRAHARGGCDYTSNVMPPTYPDGEDVEVFSFGALEKAWKETRLASEREHVTQYFLKNPGVFTLCNCANSENLSALRWTLDTPEDLEFIRQVYQRLSGGGGGIFGMREVCELLHVYPGLASINEGHLRNEGLAKSLRDESGRMDTAG